MAITKTILLTFDVEEFDLPEEYGLHIDKARQLQIAQDGLTKILLILKENNICATFFTTAYFAKCNPELIKNISEAHEIASHLYYHSNNNVGDLENSRIILSDITSKTIFGFRMPRFAPMPAGEIKKAGYHYDSSLNPTYIPGRYNNFLKKRKIHFDQETGLLIVPMSVTPIFRFPLFWLSFKNISYYLYIWLCKWTLYNDSYLHLYFHPWEFADLSEWNIPRVIKNRSGESLAIRFNKLLMDLKSMGSFDTVNSYLLRNKVD